MPAGVCHSLVVLYRQVLALLSLQEVVHVGDGGRNFEDQENVRTQIEYLLGHVVVDTGDEGDDGDNGSHSDDDAEQRQHRAQLVHPQRLQSDSNGFSDVHGTGFGLRQERSLSIARLRTSLTARESQIRCEAVSRPAKRKLKPESRSLKPESPAIAYNDCVGSWTGRSLSASSDAGRGKSELRRAVCRITSGRPGSSPSDGKCHRKYTALFFRDEGKGEKVR